VIVRGGSILDGSGQPAVVADLAIKGDTIAAIGDLGSARATTEIAANGLAVTPGFTT
jgi:N-acyl-D-amino-acid deacylase